MLEDRVPAEFKNREMHDLGCGDGKITVRLKEIFAPAKVRGFDVYPSLIGKARDRGIEAELIDLEAGLPKGELAVMWGVLHHLKDCESCLQRMRDNYDLVFIREPVRQKAIKGLEMGEPLHKEQIESWVGKYFPGATTFYHNSCIFIFYRKPNK
jgi:SAM-dependent methyltransferase